MHNLSSAATMNYLLLDMPSQDTADFAGLAPCTSCHNAATLAAASTSFAGEPGLEVCAGHGTSAEQVMQSGSWLPCDPVEGAITVNIGDALQYWSDGQLKSTYHRVRMPRANEYQASVM